MANVETQIILKLDDQFSIPAKKSLDEVQQEANSLASSLRNIEKLKKAYEEVQQIENESRRPFKEAMDGFFTGLEDEVLGWETIEGILKIGALTGVIVKWPSIFGAATVALGAFYIAWKEQQLLQEWRVAGQPIEEYVGGVKESLEQLGNAEPPALPPETVQSLETTKTCLEQIQNMQDVLITINLLDNATEQAKAIRAEIEAIFSQDITQRITIIEETIRSVAPSGSSNSFFDDGLPEFLTSSPDLTGFSKSVDSTTNPRLPSFDSGIDRVPRDMIAMIHKDEAVLSKNKADDFRQSGANGMSINNLNFSFNVPNGSKLDREEFRNMAFMMCDELKRLDRRIN